MLICLKTKIHRLFIREKIVKGTIRFNVNPTANPEVEALPEGTYLPSLWGEILAFSDHDRDLMSKAEGKDVTIYGYLSFLEPWTGHLVPVKDKQTGADRPTPAWEGLMISISPINMQKIPADFMHLNLEHALNAAWYKDPNAPASPSANRGRPPSKPRWAGRNGQLPTVSTSEDISW